MRKVTTRNNASMSRQMKKQVKEMTKRLKDKMYFDYNLMLQKYEKNGMLYSSKFFEELISSFGLSPEAEQEIFDQYRSKYIKMYKSMFSLYRDYQKENPNAEKPKSNKVYSYLPKKLKKQVSDDYNYLVGSIIGFAAAVGIADFFKRNPAKFKESNEINLEEDINDILFNSQVEVMVESMYSHHNNAIMESLERNRDDDNNFDWSDDIEEEHDSIFKQYIEGKR